MDEAGSKSGFAEEKSNRRIESFFRGTPTRNSINFLRSTRCPRRRSIDRCSIFSPPDYRFLIIGAAQRLPSGRARNNRKLLPRSRNGFISTQLAFLKRAWPSDWPFGRSLASRSDTCGLFQKDKPRARWRIFKRLFLPTLRGCRYSRRVSIDTIRFHLFPTGGRKH